MDDGETFDVGIVGAGVAGALIAYRLAEAGFSVALVEAGSTGGERTELTGAFAVAALKTPRSPYTDNAPPSPVASPDSDKDYDQGSPQTPFKSTYLRRVGGSSWHMLGNMPRLVPSDFAMTKYGQGPDWPIDYDALEPFYCEAERELGVAGDHAELDGLLGAHRSRPFPMSKIWPAYGDLVVNDAIRDLNVLGVDVRLTTTPQSRNSRPYDGRPACAGNSSCVPICPIGAKYDATVHVKKALRSGAVLRERTVATRIRLDALTRRVSAIECTRWSETERAPWTLKAKCYVIAAHAVETPRLLLVSKDANLAPAGVANSSDQVGRNLMDHLQGQCAALAGEPLYPFRGPPTTVGVDSFRDGPFRDKHAAFRLSIGNDGMGRVETPYKSVDDLIKQDLIGSKLRDTLQDRLIRQFRISYSTEMLPRSYNRVTLSDRSPDVFGVPPAKLSMQLDEYNTLAFGAAQTVIDKILDRLDATERKPQAPGTYSGAGHILGTTRMGSSAADSVVDANCRAHDHENLFIVGASTFPTSGTANPTLTVAALALRASEAIARAVRQGPAT